jgi:rod shape determining protein RodA
LRRRTNIFKSIDWLTVFLYLILIFIGWINIYAAVYNEEHQSIFDSTQRYGKQLIWIFAALFLIIVILIIDSKFYEFFAYFFYGISIFTLVFVLIFGREINGAKSWFEIGNILIQPSEFAKFATCLAIAKYFSSYNLKIHKIKTLVKIGIITFLPAILILIQNDTGSALVYASFILVFYRQGLSGTFLLFTLVIAVLFILSLVFSLETLFISLLIVSALFYYLVRPRKKEIGIGVGIFALVFSIIFFAEKQIKYEIPIYQLLLVATIISSTFYFFLAYKKKLNIASIITISLLSAMIYTSSVDYFFNNILGEHQQSRINVLLGLKSDPLGTGYNVNQSKIAIGSGGFLGKGFLKGTQTKFDFVPEQSTDFIFCTVGEEWGFAGTSVVILLYLFLLIRLLIITERQRSIFNRIYGYGVVSVLFFHFAINIGMTIGLAPVIGIPLPFFSYGGSSLWAFTILLFIFIRLDASRYEHMR